jgi:hypothetical protein
MRAIPGNPREQDLEISQLDCELSHHVKFSAWKTIYIKWVRRLHGVRRKTFLRKEVKSITSSIAW